jgi:hypothetical protein
MRLSGFEHPRLRKENYGKVKAAGHGALYFTAAFA